MRRNLFRFAASVVLLISLPVLTALFWPRAIPQAAFAEDRPPATTGPTTAASQEAHARVTASTRIVIDDRGWAVEVLLMAHGTPAKGLRIAAGP